MPCINHPEATETQFCNQCGVELCDKCAIIIAGSVYCYACKEALAGQINQQAQTKNELVLAPWERRNKIGFFEAIRQTIVGVMLHPQEFFSNMKQGGGYKEPFLFSLFFLAPVSLIVVTAFSVFFMILYNSTLFSDFMMSTPFPSEIQKGILLALRRSSLLYRIGTQIILAPLSTIASSFIMSGFAYVGLAIIGEKRRNLETIYRTLVYSMASSVLMLIPILGNLLYGVWFLISGIIGIAGTTPTSYGKSVFALLWHYVLILILVIVGIIATALIAIIISVLMK